MNNCIACRAETKNPKFCSRSCAAKINNSQFPRRAVTVVPCASCNIELVKPYQRKYCITCTEQRTLANRSISEIMNRRSYQISTQIREHARNLFRREVKINHCEICGYDKHYEVCHIKPIKDFDASVKLLEINDKRNLIALCPNCHWELDNGLLNLTVCSRIPPVF